jgi:hypothetical protein
MGCNPLWRIIFIFICFSTTFHNTIVYTMKWSVDLKSKLWCLWLFQKMKETHTEYYPEWASFIFWKNPSLIICFRDLLTFSMIFFTGILWIRFYIKNAPSNRISTHNGLQSNCRMCNRVSQTNVVNVQTGKLMLATSFSG